MLGNKCIERGSSSSVTYSFLADQYMSEVFNATLSVGEDSSSRNAVDLQVISWVSTIPYHYREGSKRVCVERELSDSTSQIHPIVSKTHAVLLSALHRRGVHTGSFMSALRPHS
jgi:hypothetical protein